MKKTVITCTLLLLLLSGCTYMDGDAMDSYHGSGDPLFVAIANNRYTYISEDGKHWREGGDTGIVKPFDIIYAEGRFIAAGHDDVIPNNVLKVSNDAVNWNDLNANGITGYISKISYQKNIYVAVEHNGTNIRILYSYNLIDWHYSGTDLDNKPESISYGNSLFFIPAKGDSGFEVLTSADGKNWDSSNVGLTIRYVTYGNTLFVAIGDAGDIYATRQPPGWSGNLIADKNIPDTGMLSIAYGNKRFVVATDKGSVLVSDTGFSWDGPSIITGQNGNKLTHIVYGNNVFITLGYYESNTRRIYYSEDGYNWSGNVAPAGFSSDFMKICFRP